MMHINAAVYGDRPAPEPYPALYSFVTEALPIMITSDTLAGVEALFVRDLQAQSAEDRQREEERHS